MKPAPTSLRSPPDLRHRVEAGLLIAMLCLGIGCTRSPLERSLARGRAWFESHVERSDPGWAHVAVLLERRFGLELRLKSGSPIDGSEIASARPQIAALYRRLSDPNARADARAIADLPSQTDRMTALALHCDQLGLPQGWAALLERASRTGGYALTHATLARAWTLENGCLPAAELATLGREQADRLAALVAQGDARGNPEQPTTDQWIEALALLHSIGARERVQPEWIAALLAAQRADGGWPLNPAAKHSDPHATVLALWVVLETLEPDAAPIRWIPEAKSAAARP